MTHRRRPFWQHLSMAGVAVCLIVVVYAAGYQQGYHVGAQPGDAPATSSAITSAAQAGLAQRGQQETTNTPTDEEAATFAVFWEAWGLLKEEFYGDLPDAQELVYAALRGVIRELDDPYTGFLPPREATLFGGDIQGTFQGIGARVDLAPTGGLIVVEPFVNQPAWEAGIRRGDIIRGVDGESILDFTLIEAIGRIRGPEGTSVTLTIYRPGDDREFDIAVTRRVIQIPITEARMLEGDVAYLRLTEFNALATRAVRQQVTELLTNKPSGFILDLRGNPGGLLSAAVEIGSYFVPRGNILIETFRDGSEVNYRRRGNLLLPSDIPLVVLVDSGSASASEIVAGALQDTARATLIGETTLGKGSVQLPHTLSDNSQLRITIARWLTPNRREIHGVGLIPDVAVAMTDEDREAGLDAQLDAAIRFLLGTPQPEQAGTPQ